MQIDQMAVAAYDSGGLRHRILIDLCLMLFPMARLIEFFSVHITLYPGSMIATGTPAAVGTFRQPPLFPQPGDMAVGEVPEIGRLSNPVVADCQSPG